jgi:dihydrofolate reductase
LHPKGVAAAPEVVTLLAMEVTLLAAQSIDGFITRHFEPGTAFTSPEDQRHFKAALRTCDASIMGGETYRVSRDTIRAHVASPRRRVVLTRTPERFADDVVPERLEFTTEDPERLVVRLRELGHRRCALLGGAQIHRLFIERGLVDLIEVTLEPRVFGTGTPLVGGPVDLRLRLLGCAPLESSDTLLARYQVLRS